MAEELLRTRGAAAAVTRSVGGGGRRHHVPLAVARAAGCGVLGGYGAAKGHPSTGRAPAGVGGGAGSGGGGQDGGISDLLSGPRGGLTRRRPSSVFLTLRRAAGRALPLHGRGRGGCDRRCLGAPLGQRGGRSRDGRGRECPYMRGGTYSSIIRPFQSGCSVYSHSKKPTTRRPARPHRPASSVQQCSCAAPPPPIKSHHPTLPILHKHKLPWAAPPRAPSTHK